MNPAISNLVLSLGLMQVGKKIDFEDPQILTYVRIGYVCSQLLCLGAYFYASIQIKAKNDTKVLKYQEPKSAMATETPPLTTTTIRDYDLAQVSSAIRSVLIGVLFMAGMHLYMKYNQPLFMQGVMPLKSLYESKILQIHVLGKPAVGALKRPFVEPAGFMSPPAATTVEETTPVESKKVESKKVK